MLFDYHLYEPRKIIPANQFRNIFLLHIVASTEDNEILWIINYRRMFTVKHMQSR